jgi:hypothetical protein
MQKGAGSQSLNDYFDELRRQGVDEKHFAAFVKNLTGSDDVGEGGDDNFPGFEYIQRVTNAAVRALTSHGEELNKAWPEIRRGRYGPGAAMQAWARLTDSYVGIFTEGLRGPGLSMRPSWLVIPYSIKTPPAPAISVRIDGFLEKDATLEYSKFEGLGSAISAKNIYDRPPEAAGSRVKFRLNHAAIKNLNIDTDHVGFIFRQGMGTAPPLVIVVLRVVA